MQRIIRKIMKPKEGTSRERCIPVTARRLKYMRMGEYSKEII